MRPGTGRVISKITGLSRPLPLTSEMLTATRILLPHSLLARIRPSAEDSVSKDLHRSFRRDSRQRLRVWETWTILTISPTTRIDPHSSANKTTGECPRVPLLTTEEALLRPQEPSHSCLPLAATVPISLQTAFSAVRESIPLKLASEQTQAKSFNLRKSWKSIGATQISFKPIS